jgi:uncharacterized membrane protein YhaH (DUF805 family)
MNFGDAVKSFWSKYVDFSGRARRSEYWWVVLFLVIVTLPLSIVDLVLFGELVLDAGIGVLTALFTLAILLPGLSLSVRRLHDIGMSGWFVLLFLIPFAGSVFGLVIALIDSQRGANKFGPSPKYPTVEAEV